MNEIKYPVKYVLRKVNNNRGSAYDIGAFIVSKCYVISVTIDFCYFEPRKIFYVVYTHELDENNNIINNKPKFNEFLECYNSVKVDRLFDNYDEAKKCAVALNDYLIESVNIYSNCHSVIKKDELEKLDINQLNMYYELEQKLLLASDDIKLTRKKIDRIKKERL